MQAFSLEKVSIQQNKTKQTKKKCLGLSRLGVKVEFPAKVSSLAVLYRLFLSDTTLALSFPVAVYTSPSDKWMARWDSEQGEWLHEVRTPFLWQDRGWRVPVIPSPCSGSSYALQTVWNSLRQENRLKAVFQILFSRSFVKNNLVMWARSKSSPCFSIKSFSHVTAHSWSLYHNPVLRYGPGLLRAVQLG